MFKFQSNLFFLHTALKHVKTILQLYEPRPHENLTEADLNSKRNYASFNNLSGSESDFNLFFKGFCRVESKINIGKVKGVYFKL